MFPLVSIIIPVYNSEKYLYQCLWSVAQQTYSNIEVIVIDDCSTDSSLSIVNDFFGVYKTPYKIIRNPKNVNVSASRNSGIAESNGEYIFFLDSDDIIHSDYISCFVNYLQNGNYDYVFCDFTRFSETDNIDITMPYHKINCREFHYKEKADIIRAHGYPCGGGYRSSILKKQSILFPKDCNYMEDCIFNAQYHLYINKVGIINIPLYYYRKNPNSLSNSKSKDVTVSKTLIACDSFNKAFRIYKKQYSKEYIEYRRFFRNCFFGELKVYGFKNFSKYKGVIRESKNEIAKYIFRANLKIGRKIIELIMLNYGLERLIYQIRFKIS